MKYLTLLIISIFISFESYSEGTLPNLVVSYEQPGTGTGNAALPSEDQINLLWIIHQGCFAPPELATHVEYSDLDINVFTQIDITDNVEMRCTPLPPPSYLQLLQFDYLDRGKYTLHYHYVPTEDTFPPKEQDYSNYFVESIFFEVQGGAPRIIDATSNLGLLLLSLLLFMSVYFGLRHRIN